ncbi:MAG: hypothetical protein DSM106950_00395 [Stigonema ocellatum SAG 48.90 = DSM 106950]|nr:hypothetical protein [Stigonema ocellatum SAG 48.90 = DSM 106950]
MLNELVRTMAEMAVQSNRDRSAHRAEIEEIWRYLRYEPRNGNGRGEG